MLADLKPITVSLGNLLLDPNNFRLNNTLPNYSDSQFEDLQSDTLQKILKGYGVQDLERSILEHGWLDVDQIVVRHLRVSLIENNPKFVVVEGNRRIAALLNLISEYNERNLNVPAHIDAPSKALRVMLLEGEEDVVDLTAEVIMGMRHVGGPRKWDGLKAAMLVVRLCDEKNYSFSDAGKILGISSIEAGRRYRAYKAYAQALEEHEHQNNLYALLGEFIRIKPLREWLSWSEDNNRFNNEKNLHIVYRLLGLKNDDESQDNKLTNPQSVRDFGKIIENEKAKRIFEETKSLQEANEKLFIQNSLSSRISLLCEQISEVLQEYKSSNFSDAEKQICLDLSMLINNKFGGPQS